MSDSPKELAHKLVELCAELEVALKRRGAPADSVGLAAALRDMPRDRVVDRYRQDLMSFANLRNAIVHVPFRDDSPIATPLPETIQEATKVLKELTEPTRALRNPSRPVIVKEEDPLRDCLRLMGNKDFSQLPVLTHDGIFSWLLTTNAIARWLASNFDDDGYALLQNVHVSDVRECCEKQDRGIFVNRNITAVDAIHELTKDDAPVALLVTQTGKASESIIGILVRADVPAMQSALQI